MNMATDAALSARGSPKNVISAATRTHGKRRGMATTAMFRLVRVPYRDSDCSTKYRLTTSPARGNEVAR